jgi:hypothetical protein
LIKKYDYVNFENSDPQTGEPFPLYPWVEKPHPTIVQFGKPIHNKEELENVIRCAQDLTLSPHINPVQYAAGPWHKLKPTLQFSPNMISLEIIAPDAPNLSFYDLPGVISQAIDVSNIPLVFSLYILISQYRVEKKQSLSLKI